MIHDYITNFLPDLYSKELDIYMSSSFNDNIGVNNINIRIIVLLNYSRRVLGKPNLPNHRPK